MKNEYILQNDAEMIKAIKHYCNERVKRMGNRSCLSCRYSASKVKGEKEHLCIFGNTPCVWKDEEIERDFKE